jgi:hypothetical protein
MYINCCLDGDFPFKKKKDMPGQTEWLTPEILATWEAEIRRIAVRGQPRQTVHEIPSKLILGHGDVHLSSQRRRRHK